MKKYIVALIVLILAVAAYLKFWRKPPDQDGAQDGESGQTGGTGTASSDTSSNTTNTNTNAGGSVAADTKKQLTSAQVTEIQRQTNKWLRTYRSYIANPSAYQRYINLMPAQIANNIRITASTIAQKNIPYLKEDGILGTQTATTFQIVFGMVINKYLDYKQVSSAWMAWENNPSVQNMIAVKQYL